MKAAKFDYERPADLAGALALLGRAGADVKLLAGGQSLGPMLNLRLAQPELLVDISKLPEMRQIVDAADAVTIGACVTHAAIEDGAVPDPANGMLAAVAAGIAYRAVRNRGTVGGSLAHADPAADWLTTMAVLGAAIIMQGAKGVRTCPAASFVQGPFATALAPGELIVAIEVPRLSPAARWGYQKICRKTGEFARAIGAAVLDERAGLARVVCGAVGAAPIELPRTAARLAEAGDTAAAALVADELSAARGAAPWQLHAVAVRRALADLAAPARAA